MAKEKPYHFNLLKHLFYNADGSIKKTWGTLTLATKVRHKWPRLREYCASITNSGQYGELRYLLDHDWEYKKCLVCGQPTKWAGGRKFHDYCSNKCAVIASNNDESIKKRNKTRTEHYQDTLKKTGDWTVEELPSHDDEMISLLTNGLDENGKVIYTSDFIRTKTSHDPKYINVRFWLNNRIPWSRNYSETLFCILHHITEQPHCKMCDNIVNFNGHKGRYNIYCSIKCMQNDKDVKNHLKELNKLNAVERGKKISETKSKRTQEQKDAEQLKQWITNELGGGYNKKMIAIRKMKKTNLERGGHECALHRTDIKGTYTKPKPTLNSIALNASKRSAQFNSDPQYSLDLSEALRYTNALKGKEAKQAKIENFRYWYYSGGIERVYEQASKRSKGVKKWHASLTDEQRKKNWHNVIFGMLQSWLKETATNEDLDQLDIKYVEDVTKQWWDKKDDAYKTRVFVYVTNTNKRGKPRSKEEEDIYDYIKATFGDIVVKRNFATDKYPFMCDFYIPCIDTYIEHQGYTSHGGRPFNINNDDDIEKVNKWHDAGHDTWIYNWTVSDVKKRETAKENGIKYYETWSVKEAIDLIDKLYENYIKY